MNKIFRGENLAIGGELKDGNTPTIAPRILVKVYERGSKRPILETEMLKDAENTRYYLDLDTCSMCGNYTFRFISVENGDVVVGNENVDITIYQ